MTWKVPETMASDDLIRSSDDAPGISRRKRGRGFSYHRHNGKLISDDELRARIASLAIPPAWTDVWICPHPNGHIQATGRDDKDRKQYRYHPLWEEKRSATKFERLGEFGKALARIRHRVQHDLKEKKLSKTKITAAAVRVLDHTGARIGDADYTRQNGSYGITTLRREHWRESSKQEDSRASICLNYIGKGGRENEWRFRSESIRQAFAQSTGLPGEHLFQYPADDGSCHSISADDVNAYLHETDDRISAKDFRTWRASLLCFAELSRLTPAETPQERQQQIREAIDATAAAMQHKADTCRKSYIHPGILSAFESGEPGVAAKRFQRHHSPRQGLSKMEEELLKLLDSG